AALVQELHQVDGGEVAGGVVEDHVLGAGVGGVDPVRVRAGVPVVNRGVVLQPGIAAGPGRIGHHPHQVTRLVGVHDLAGRNGEGVPGGILLHGLHEVVLDPDAVVGVLEEALVVSGAVEGRVVSAFDEG